MSITKLVNIGGIKHGGDPKKDIENLSKQVQKEFDHLRQGVNKSLSNIATGNSTTSTTVIVNNGGGGGSSSPTTTIQSKAGIIAITSVSDVLIPFTGDAIASYVLMCYFLDGTSQFASIPVPQSDQASTGFTVRSGNLPGVGMLFYTATPIN